MGPDPTAFKAGTYYGEKAIYNFSADYYSSDTITIKFDGIRFLYSGSSELDYGKGYYLITRDSIEFNDEYARNALYSWDWILLGKFKFNIIGDSLVLTRKYCNQLTTCRLIRVAEQ